MERNDLSIFVEDLPRNIPSFVEIHQVVMEEMLFEGFFFLVLSLVAIFCRQEEHFEQFQ